jgi:hypothetical protein
MPCSQTLSGIARDCAANMGGIVEVYLANKSDVSAVTETSGKITAITMASSAKFKTYQFKPATSSMSSNYQVNQENGTVFVQTDLLMVFNRMETAKRIEISAMAQGELCAIVKDANGLYWLLGKDEPLLISAGDGLSGTARADRNGYSITLQDNSLEMPAEILVGDGGVDLSTIVA